VAAISLHEKHRLEAERQRHAVNRAVGDAVDAPGRRKAYRLPGDPFALRGIPMVGKLAIGGAIPGTVPGHGLFDE
jgi:hypothetical protein